MRRAQAAPATNPLLTAALTLSVDRVTAEVAARLERALVPFLVLKGPSLARWLYSGAEPRRYLDTDLLVEPRAERRAEDVLAAAGFTPDSGTGRSEPGAVARNHVWTRDGHYVELHVTLIGVTAEPEAMWSAFRDGADTLVVAGQLVPVPGVAARTLHVALHAAQHGPAAATPMTDLSRAVERLPRSTWRQATALGSRVGAVEALSAGLRLTPAGEELAASLDLPIPTDPQVVLRASGAPASVHGYVRLLRAPLDLKLKMIVRAIAPAPEFLRWWTPVARRGPLGLAVAYVWRPVYLLLRLPQSALTWRRLRGAGTTDGR